MMRPMAVDPFEGLGKALAHLRERAGFSTQTEASEVLKIDKGQLSRCGGPSTGRAAGGD